MNKLDNQGNKITNI